MQPFKIKQVINTGISLLSLFYRVEWKLNTSCPLCDFLIKVSQMLYNMLLKTFGFVRYLLPLGRVTLLSRVWCMVYLRYSVQRGWVVIECGEYLCNWYCDMLRIGACKCGAGTYPSWQAVTCFDCSSVCDTKYRMYGTCECRSPMDCRYKPMNMP